MNLARATYLISWWFFGILIYHTIHQLRLINLIYTTYTRIDLFRMKPLYEFSNLTALTAGSLITLPYIFSFLNPTFELTNPVIFSIYLIISIIALVTFLLPQLGIHRLQEAEQEVLLNEVNQRYKATMVEIHKRVDMEKFEDAAALGSTLAVLSDERKAIEAISTWPWQPETLRWLFTGVLLPILIFILQHFIGLFLSS